jgi:serine/threonine protein kinase
MRNVMSSKNSTTSLENLAAQIADDKPVDWHEASGAGDSSDDSALQGLRELEQVVNGFRHAQLAEGRATPTSSKFQFGGLTVIELLGAGGQGDVWRAYDPLLDLQVALKLRKIGSDVLSHQFLEEARRLARVRQANIVSVYGAAVHDGRAGLWMELIRGTSLADLLAEQGPFPATDVRAIGLDLCHALAAVHRHGLIHGDVKLENVMREISGRTVLMDFGASSEVNREPSAVVSGSLRYLAPEVLAGGSPSVASDIYALGVLLHRLLTGEYPDAKSSLRARCPGAPKALVAAIEMATRADPARRHTSALAFATALSTPAPRGFDGWRGLAMVVALIAIAASAIGVFMSIQRTVSVPTWQTDQSFHRGDVALTDGATVALGDRLSLAFRSNETSFVYVFDDDGSGEAAVLFPLQGVEPKNPLNSNTDYQLPGKSSSQSVSWQVSSNAQREQFIVIAANVAQPQLDAAIAAWRHAAKSDTSRGALNLAPKPAQAEISSAALRTEMEKLAANDPHIRQWRYVFPHKPE